MAQLVMNRFIDEFRPGDMVPAGRYTPEELAALYRRGAVVAVEVTATADPPPAGPPPAKRKARR